MRGAFFSGCSSRMNGKPSSPVLRGLGASNGAQLLDSNCAGSPLAALVYRDAHCLLRRSWLIIRSTMYLASGTRLGPYRIEAPIGAGGMGEVYRATDTRLNRDVALKILPSRWPGVPKISAQEA